MIEERRKHPRFPAMRNVGEPVQLRVSQNNHKELSIPGFIMNLSAGGMSILTLGHQSTELLIGTRFVLDLKLSHLVSHNVEGKIIRVYQGPKAKLHHSNEEWILAIEFTKIKPATAHHLNQMAEDWSICETKMEMKLPDICFRECHYWYLCEKSIKLEPIS